MDHTLILAIIQGITEFLPVSSSAHLIAAAQFFGIQEPGRLLEVVLHMGTVLVVLLYFRTSIWNMIRGIFGLLQGKILPGAEEFFKICWGSLPVIVAGYFIHSFLPEGIHTLKLIASVSIAMGILLILVDLTAPTYKLYHQLTYKDAFIVGCFQTLALIPGASRLGSTLIGGRLCGYQRGDTAKLSFMLSIPAVIGANTLVGLSLWKEGVLNLDSNMYGALILAFVIGMAAIRFFMYWLQTHTLLFFGVYRILFGVGLLFLI
jgi:undecaprenyl-diphosphatase